MPLCGDLVVLLWFEGRWPSSDGPAETVSVRTYRSGAAGVLGGGAPSNRKRDWLRASPFEGGAVSRFLFLNLPFIFATYPPASDGPPSSAGIFGLAGLPPYPSYVAAWRRGLLPRVFTLAGLLRRSFSVTDGKDYSLLCFPQSGALPCADFPHRDSFAALGMTASSRECRRGRSSRLPVAKVRIFPYICRLFAK